MKKNFLIISLFLFFGLTRTVFGATLISNDGGPTAGYFLIDSTHSQGQLIYLEETSQITGGVFFNTADESAPATSTAYVKIFNDENLGTNFHRAISAAIATSTAELIDNNGTYFNFENQPILEGGKYYWLVVYDDYSLGDSIRANFNQYTDGYCAQYGRDSDNPPSLLSFCPEGFDLRFILYGEVVEESLEQAAANSVKELVNSAYLYGGKGWDYNQHQFVAPSTVKTGYSFWNQLAGSAELGAGVDCSGLIMWAYNRSFDPSKSRFDNFVKAEGADEQFRENTELITELQLQPGDVIFSDFDGNNFIDHVAMYVGESGGFDVVSAVNKQTGIVGRSKDILKKPENGFVAFKRVISALPPKVLVAAGSPVDLTVTEPDGFTITPTTIIPSDLEFLRQIPGVLYYSEMERGADGNPIDQVYSYTLKTGDYTVQVLPEPGTPSGATYTLDFSAGEQSITLAQDTPISQIPSDGYGITTSDTGALNTFIPVSIDIKPGSFPNSINLKSSGVISVAIFGNNTFDVNEINLDAIKFADAAIKLKKSGQFMASYEDLNGDGIIDLIIHFATKELNLTSSDTKANLEGRLINEEIIKGSDSIRIVP